MEEYIRLEEEKARKRRKVFNWETAKYDKIWYDEDVLDLRSVKTEFPAIVFNYSLTSNETPYCEPTVSSFINEIDFRISFDESDDEDCTCIDPYMALPLRDQRHQYLRYEGLQYTDADIEDLETRLARIYRREIHRVQVFNLGGLPDLMAGGLSTRMLMEHKDAQGQSMFGEAILDLDMPELYSFSWVELGSTKSARWIPDKGNLRDYWIKISSPRDFLGTAPSYTFFAQGSIVGYALAHAVVSLGGVKHLKRKSFRFWSVIALAFPIIDMAELVRLKLCVKLDDTWAWVPAEPARQEGGAGGVAEEAPVAPGRGDEDEVKERCLDSMTMSFPVFLYLELSLAFATRLMDKAGIPYTRYSKSLVEYQRRTRQRTDEPSTSAALQQPDP
ncbi:hypothetical protein Tco_0897552 [Tanacetum coccineum]